jgi:Lipoprotein LpqB beta-propeller domain/Sporulation and spore germination
VAVVTRRRLVRVAAGLAVFGLLSVTGCATIPTSGRVRQGAAAGGEPVDTRVRVFAVPPRAGASPSEIVRGFLEASASSEGRAQRTARLYLSAAARSSWRPEARIVVYDNEDGFSLSPQAPATVLLTGRRVGDIDGRGAYVQAAANQSAQAEYRLAREGGQWRIAALPDGLFLTRFELLREYRPVNLYFFDPTFSVLVPDPVFLPARSGLATALVAELLRGPTEWLAPAVRSAFPADTALQAPSVPVENGEARVDLAPTALGADENQRRAMSAQLVWTLRQVPDVTGVRMTVDGAPFVVPGQGDVQSRSRWQDFDPDNGPRAATAYWVERGRGVGYDGNRVAPVAGALGEGRVSIRSLAVSLSAGMAAAVSADGTALLSGALRRGGAYVVEMRGGDLTAPSWDRQNLVWVAERRAAASSVWVVAENGPPRQVAVPDLAQGQILALRVARDGVRVAVVVGRSGVARLFLGRIERTDGVRISGLRRLAHQLVDVQDVAWDAADRVVALGREREGALQPWLLDVDGFGATPRLPIVGMVSVAAAPGRPLLVGTADGSVWEQSSPAGWQKVAPGGQPAYPG